MATLSGNVHDMRAAAAVVDSPSMTTTMMMTPKDNDVRPNNNHTKTKTLYDRHEWFVWCWEPSTPTPGDVLTQDGITQIAFHQYKAGTYTWLDTKLNPIWQSLTELLPLNMAPNLVTAIGGLHCLASYLLTWMYCPNLDNPVPSWLLVVNCWCNMVYYTMDCMDGKQARRTNSSSPVGQLFDHGVDCLCLLTHLSSVQAWFGVPYQSYFGIQAILQFSFFVAQWEEYYTGVLPHATGHVGVTEVNYAIAFVSLFNSAIDRSIYRKSLEMYIPLPLLMTRRFRDVIVFPLLDPTATEWQVQHVMTLGWYGMMSTLILLSFHRVLSMRSGIRHQVSALGKLVTPAVVALAPFLLSSDILIPERRYVSLAVGLAMCLMTIKLIVFSMARQAYAVIQWDAVPILVVMVWMSTDTNITPHGIHVVWQGLCVWYVFRLRQWTASAIDQLCERLNIQLFTLRKKTV